MTKIILCGCAGRMGRQITEAISRQADMTIVLGVEAPGHPLVGGVIDQIPIVDNLLDGGVQGDLIVDFTLPATTTTIAAIAAERGIPFLSGVTGLDDDQYSQLRVIARVIPVLHASNMSLGVSLAGDLIDQAARFLPDYDIEITEMHHRHKKDSPSGTALNFAKILETARGDLKCQFGRQGDLGSRQKSELGIHSMRGGEVIGEHHVTFAGTGERLIISHIADSRSAFVTGVEAAARFLVIQSPGLYSIKDVLATGSG